MEVCEGSTSMSMSMEYGDDIACGVGSLISGLTLLVCSMVFDMRVETGVLQGMSRLFAETETSDDQ